MNVKEVLVLASQSSCRVLLTADRTMMSNYGNSIFYGFLASAPTKVMKYIPIAPLLRSIFVGVPSDSKGRAVIASQGMRRIESALINYGGLSREEVVVADPRNIKGFISESTKIIGIAAIDPLGKGPSTTTFSGEFGWIHEEPYNAEHFRNLVLSRVVQVARKRGTKVVVGGPGAYQFNLDIMARYGIDVVVDGEADLMFPEVAKKLLKGELKTPIIIKPNPNQIPDASQIPPLIGGTVGGIVEVSRGCGRGCKFCMPTLRRIRHRSVPDIVEDVKLNVKCGQTYPCLHAEDILRYGTTSIMPQPEKVIELFKAVKSIEGITGVAPSHVALASIATIPKTVKEISEILALDKRNWMGFQTGIETGSPELLCKLMNMKAAPFKSTDWHSVVKNAFGTCHDNNWVPCGTLVINLPGETEEDVLKTAELVEDLYNYKSFIVPLLFTPFEGSGGKPMRLMEDAKAYHLELYRTIWRHDMHWMNDLADDYLRYNKSPLTKLSIKVIVGIATSYLNARIVEYLDEKLKIYQPMLDNHAASEVAAT
jgi:radical SAM superfamily enzyme YgiQ (UPF0313 family)